VVIRRGEVWWAGLAGPAGHRPVLILSRNEACEVRRYLTVAPVTTRVRDIPTEVALGAADGMPRACVVNLDSIATVARSRLTRRVATLHPAKIAEVNRALKFALGVS
jgi:mRNA interferase MazF